MFEGEIRALVGTRAPGTGTPCGGVTVGSADRIVHEWSVPNGTARILLLLETDAPAAPFPLRLCVIHEDGEEIVARGPPPLELEEPVASGEDLVLVVMPDDETSTPQGPQRVTITATPFA